ncbi:thiamine diphosphate-binding protein [Lipomyces tetrasporus]|uniref:Thiamine diphosphate-binding protein n=1 Tax=Lipomyces tetrasporus TaxID=54092 RepID=A0AAD7VQC5_9ASCO|nr:thiamine diphosphate-binding protein [Lipomyces tetrasporus]KAJ8097449.1 thiamine diphosphate-binding protein [Lipomyces tetrasporus]
MTLTETIPLGDYLFQRIRQLGITKILGCPGDFNMTLLDHIFNVEGLDWVGNCNELNAAYAADGYGRVRGLPGVIITTYGVGELSAINGVSGSFAEHVPVLHIVGTPARPEMEYRMWMHHTLPGGSDSENPDHSVYQRMSAPVRCVCAVLDDVDTLAEEIDRVLMTIWRKSLPGYIYVPLDIVNAPVPRAKLDVALRFKIVNPDPSLEDALVLEILDAIYKSKSPAILVDILARRHRARELVMELIEKTGIPSFSTDMAKGFVDEDHPSFVGQYNGRLSRPGVADAVESSDVVINIGPLISDSNTGGFTRFIDEKNLIMLHPSYVEIFGVRHDGLHFLPILEKLVARIDKSKLPELRTAESFNIGPPKTVESPADITTSYFYKYMGDSFLKPNDIVFAESGTAQYGINDAQFPKNVNFTTQLYYSSIGFALPAALGACVAQREIEAEGGPKARVVLFEGDGSAMMTAQELSTITRYGYNPIIFLINNSGYTIERAIHGPQAKYNDITPHWNWTGLFKTFGADESKYISAKVTTKKELEELLLSKEFAAAEGKARFVEVVMDKLDIPWRLTEQVATMSEKVKQWFNDYSTKRGEIPRAV